MELVMQQNRLIPEEIKQRFQDFTETETYQTMKKEDEEVNNPEFSNSTGVDLSFYDEETVQSDYVESTDDLSPIKKGYFIVANLSNNKLLKVMYMHDPNSSKSKMEGATIKQLLTENDHKVIKTESFLNGSKKDSYSKETSESELKPNPDAFQVQSESSRGVVFKKNKIQLSFPCKSECCTFGGVDYQYCGSNCGKRGDHGGGQAANLLDGCCFSHDECYHEGTDHCECDGDLVSCANDKSDPGANTIAAFFAAKRVTVCDVT